LICLTIDTGSSCKHEGESVMDLMLRPYLPEDERRVRDLWADCSLTVPWNDPGEDIRRKLEHSPELFFVAEREGWVVGTCMAGYDGHRGWVYYLGVDPGLRMRGIAARMMRHAEELLEAMGCPKIDLMVRESNGAVREFYRRIGYRDDPVAVMSKRLQDAPPSKRTS